MRWIRIMLLMWLVVLGWEWWQLNKTRMIVCDVGQGDAILFEKGMNQLLVDTGNGEGRVLNCLSKYMPFWDKEIEAVIITHEDEDHSGGLTATGKYYRIDKIIGGMAESGKIEQIMYSFRVGENDEISSGPFNIDIASPSINESEGNEASVVGLLHYRNKSVWLMGDAGKEVEDRLVWQKKIKGKADILKVSHHGSASGTSEEFLEAIQPTLAVISVGEKNRFGHPAKETLERLQKAGVVIERTDESGDIVIEL